MKKIFITLILSIIGFIGFGSCVFLDQSSSVNCTPAGYNTNLFGQNCSPSTINLGSQQDFTISSNTWVKYQLCDCNGSCGGRLKVNLGYYGTYTVNACIINFLGSETSDASIVVKYSEEISDIEYLISNIPSSIIPVFNELIPYVLYIGLGILVVTIGFVAIKWLMLWIYNKVKFIFKK